MSIADWAVLEARITPVPKSWPPPTTDYIALSVGGSFSVESGAAAEGMILRRYDGFVILQHISLFSIAAMHWKRRYMKLCKGWCWVSVSKPADLG